MVGILRIKMRKLLVAVLIAGIASYVFIVRARRFREIAESHRKDPYRLYFPCFGPSWIWARFAWGDAMLKKYEHAADHPWLPVLPDPPMPGPADAVREPINPTAGPPIEVELPSAVSSSIDDNDPFRPLPPLPRAGR
jgi:hypothetical protein